MLDTHIIEITDYLIINTSTNYKLFMSFYSSGFIMQLYQLINKHLFRYGTVTPLIISPTMFPNIHLYTYYLLN